MAVRTALLLGATGLVGAHCLDFLLSDAAYSNVTTVGRRPLARTHPKLSHHVIDFDRMQDHAARFQGQDVFCCLGTTIKQAGSKEMFRRVDFHYPREAARLAQDNGAAQFLLVSALGANPNSFVFYNRVKGEVEEVVQAFPFYGVYLFRPSLLVGERRERRTAEQAFEFILDKVSFALQGPLAKYRPIEARTVAQSLVAVARQQPGGRRVYEPEAIRSAAHWKAPGQPT